MLPLRLFLTVVKESHARKVTSYERVTADVILICILTNLPNKLPKLIQVGIGGCIPIWPKS